MAMRAVGYQFSRPVSADDALVDLDLPVPVATGRDLLVAVRAVSVNPVDTKVRLRAQAAPGEWKILGWDAAGVVAAVGPEVTRFKVDDPIFYAGALGRQGTNAEYHLVDERIVGHMPRTLDWAQAAALPLTALTAWEMLFDRLDIRRSVPGAAPSVLIVGGAGGVGSVAIQLVRALTGLEVIATASRPETRDWVVELGATHVIDHAHALAPQVAALPGGAPGFVFSTTRTDRHLADIAELIAPQGHMGLIDDPPVFDILPFKAKSVAVHWELMFTRSMFGTPDIGRQGEILDEVARLVDAGTLRSTLAEQFGPICAANLKRAHALLESGRARGKIVLEGFSA